MHARATLLYNLLEALGDSVSNQRWEALLDMPPQVTTVIPQSALWQTLDQAVEGAKENFLTLISLGEGKIQLISEQSNDTNNFVWKRVE